MLSIHRSFLFVQDPSAFWMLSRWVPRSARQSTLRPPGAAPVEAIPPSPPAPGTDRVRIAGDPERETRAKREKDGIAVDANTWLEIHAAGAKVGVSAATIDRHARG